MDGILLGTGGLVRAYSEVTKNAIDSVGIIEQEKGYKITLEVLYSDFDKLKYYLIQNKISTSNVLYVENIVLTAYISVEKYNMLVKNINNLNFKIIDYKILDNVLVNID